MLDIVFDKFITPIATEFTKIFVINKSKPDDKIELNLDTEFQIPDEINSFTYFISNSFFEIFNSGTNPAS